jgi:hypothetical protein
VDSSAGTRSSFGANRLMPATWSAAELARIDGSDELQIAVRSRDETLRRWVPIWVVCVGDQVYVRTWHRRDNGWFGRVLESRRAQIRVPGLDAAVAVLDVGSDEDAEPRAGVDAAYRAKYGRYGSTTVDRMVNDDAAATTLRLNPEHAAPAGAA